MELNALTWRHHKTDSIYIDVLIVRKFLFCQAEIFSVEFACDESLVYYLGLHSILKMINSTFVLKNVENEGAHAYHTARLHHLKYMRRM